MVTDEMVFAAVEAGRAEMKAWTIAPSPIIGVDKVTLHDAYRKSEAPAGPDAVYTVYDCDSRKQAMEVITGLAWRAGIEAALAAQAAGATKQ